VSSVTPSRRVIISLNEERRAMREGYAFLDEKCLLLAGAMLRELRSYEELRREFQALQRDARLALRNAVGRHGLQGLQCYPPCRLDDASVRLRRRPLLGVALQDAELVGAVSFAPPPAYPSPEADACRALHAEMIKKLVALAAHSGNLERLYREYRRTARRARALQDVLLPEVSRTIGDFEARLEELEQDEALWARRALRKSPR